MNKISTAFNSFVQKLREPMNGFTHFIGFCLGLLATVLLVLESVAPLRLYHLIGFAVFCAGMLAMYAMSTIYHWAKLSPRGIKNLRRIDHIMIFLMIAGTYTPICLIPLRDSFGIPLLISVWSVALAGIFFKLFWLTSPRWLSTAIYIGMGWLAVFIVVPLCRILDTGALLWLLIGGIFYTVGAVIYGMKKPNFFSNFGFHELFHVFVILGSFSHFWMLYHYIALLQ